MEWDDLSGKSTSIQIYPDPTLLSRRFTVPTRSLRNRNRFNQTEGGREQNQGISRTERTAGTRGEFDEKGCEKISEINK